MQVWIERNRPVGYSLMMVLIGMSDSSLPELANDVPGYGGARAAAANGKKIALETCADLRGQMLKFLYNDFMAANVLRVPSLTYDRVHEYRVGPRGAIEHRLTLQEGGTRSDGTSEWTVASKDYIRAAVCHAQSYVTEWFRARGITCESVAAMIAQEKRTKKPPRAKSAPHLILK